MTRVTYLLYLNPFEVPLLHLVNFFLLYLWQLSIYYFATQTLLIATMESLWEMNNQDELAKWPKFFDKIQF